MHINGIFRYFKKTISREIVFLSCLLSIVLAWVDHNNILYLVLTQCTSIYNLIIVLIIAIMVYILLLPFLNNQYRISFVNSIDKECLTIIFSLAEYWLLQLLFIHSFYFYKKIMLVFLLIFYILFFLYRLYILNIKCNSSEEIQNFVYSLNDLYKGEIISKEDNIILIKDEAADYDLFEFGKTVDVAESYIHSVSKDDFFVIGVEGEWGKGKTTFSNLLKKRFKDQYQIIDFNPWKYSKPESLLSGFFDKICSVNGYSYNNFHIKSLIRSICSLFPTSENLSEIIFDLFNTDSEPSMEQLRSYIYDICKSSDKQIVVFVDDLERSDASNIIFLFKILGNLINVNNLVIILMYDKNRLNDVLKNTLQIDIHYYEKLINAVITIPKISPVKYKEVYGRCIENLWELYSVSGSDQYTHIVDFLSDNLVDTRNFIRIINSCFGKVFGCKHSLNISDLLSIEIIKFLNSDLYLDLYDNRIYFVTYDFLDPQPLDKSITKCFNEFCDKYPKYLNIICFLFPTFEKYALAESTNKVEDSSQTLTQTSNCRINNLKYFDLFYSFGTNIYTEIHDDVENTIDKINHHEFDSLMLTFEGYDKNNRNEFLAQFESNCILIDDENRIEFAFFLLEKLDLFSNAYRLKGLSDQSIVIGIIVNLLIKCEFNEFTTFLNEKLLSHYLVLYYLLSRLSDPIKEDITETEKLNFLKLFLCDICNSIINNNTDIFNSHYRSGELAALYNFYLKMIPSGAKEKFGSYINEIMQPANVYMILDGCKVVNFDENHHYLMISKDQLDIFSLDYNQVKDCILRNQPSTEYEKLLVKALDRGKDKSSDKYSFEQRAVVLDNVQLKFGSISKKNSTSHASVGVSDDAN